MFAIKYIKDGIEFWYELDLSISHPEILNGAGWTSDKEYAFRFMCKEQADMLIDKLTYLNNGNPVYVVSI